MDPRQPLRFLAALHLGALLWTFTAPSALALDWTTQTVDTHGGEFACLALDPAGNPHITYQSGQGDRYLRYAAYDGTSWSTETIEPGGRRTSLAIDSNGVEHISHSTDPLAAPFTTVLRYLTRAAGSWQGENVGPGGSTSIALDAAGRPCIAHGYTEVGLNYSQWTGAQWLTETVDPGGTDDISLALLGGTLPRVAYKAHLGHDLRFAAWDGAGWTIETLDTSVSDPSLALDSAGRPHIAYYKDGVLDLKYALWDGAAWQFATVDQVGTAGWQPSLALDTTDTPHIAYFAENTLRYATFTGGQWLIETVDGPDVSGWATSIVVDEAGAVHIAYGNAMGGVLKYAVGVPEPSTLALVALGGLALLRRRK